MDRGNRLSAQLLKWRGKDIKRLAVSEHLASPFEDYPISDSYTPRTNISVHDASGEHFNLVGSLKITVDSATNDDPVCTNVGLYARTIADIQKPLCVNLALILTAHRYRPGEPERSIESRTGTETAIRLFY
jgi:hypothetical protein